MSSLQHRLPEGEPWFTCSVSPPNSTAMWVRATGELDRWTAHQLIVVVEAALDSTACVAVDLRGLSFIDGYSLARLADLSRSARAGRRRLVLLGGGLAFCRLLALASRVPAWEAVHRLEILKIDAGQTVEQAVSDVLRRSARGPSC